MSVFRCGVSACGFTFPDLASWKLLWKLGIGPAIACPELHDEGDKHEFEVDDDVGMNACQHFSIFLSDNVWMTHDDDFNIFSSELDGDADYIGFRFVG